MYPRHWNPLGKLLGLRGDAARLPACCEGESDTRQHGWNPPVDIFETGDRLVLRAELPGLSKKDVRIRLENNVLSISGERPFDDRNRDSYHRIEGCYGSFRRSFSLPSDVDAKRIEAKMDDGVLEVVMPRAEEAKPKEITIA